MERPFLVPIADLFIELSFFVELIFVTVTLTGLVIILAIVLPSWVVTGGVIPVVSLVPSIIIPVSVISVIPVISVSLNRYTEHLVLVGSAPPTANVLLPPPTCFVVRFSGLVALAYLTSYIYTVPLCDLWNGRVSIENTWCILAWNVRHSCKSYIESLAESGGPHLSVVHVVVSPRLAMNSTFPFPQTRSIT